MKKLLVFIFLAFITQSNAQIITTFAGNGVQGYSGDGGQATSAKLNKPFAVIFDQAGNMYISDTYNSTIRKVTTTGVISTIAGASQLGGHSGDGGPAVVGDLAFQEGICFDASGNLYLAEVGFNTIRKINTAGTITTIAGVVSSTGGYSGDGGAAVSAKLNTPTGVAVDALGNVYFTDLYNNRVRKINTAGIISTFAGTGTIGYSGDGGQASLASFNNPSALCFDTGGNLFVADLNNNVIRKIDPTGIITTVVGNGTNGYSGDGASALSAQLNNPSGILVDPNGNMFITDGGYDIFGNTTNNVIRKVDVMGNISTLVGTGTAGYSGDGGVANLAQLNQPQGNVAFDANGNLYLADKSNFVIRKVALCSSPISVNISGTTSICGGTSTTLTASGATSYTWSANTGYAVSNTVSLSPNTSTTYTVVGSTGGCYGKSVVTVTVNPVLSISGSTTICPGVPTTLTGSGASTYTWSANAGNATTNTISVAPMANTTYTVTGSTGGCTSTKTITLIMAVPIVSVTGSVNICKGTSTLLTGQGATTYTWSANTGSATTSTVSVSPLSDSVYTITGVKSGCVTSNTVIVHVGSPTPTLTVNGNAGICPVNGITSTTLTAATANTYSWSANAGGSTNSSIVVSPTVTTIYTVTGSNGACSVSNTFTVTVSTSTPTVSLANNINNICSGTVVTFTANASASHTLSPVNSTSTTVTVTPSSTTTYTLLSVNGYCVSTDTLTIFVTPTPNLAIAGNHTVCSAYHDTLTASGASSYTWSANAGGVNTNTVVVTLTNNGPGYFVGGTYTVTGANGACVASKSITVTYAYAPVIYAQPSQTVCTGQAVQAYSLYNPNIKPGTDIFWTNNNTNIGLGASGSHVSGIFSYTAPNVSTQQTATIIAGGYGAGVGTCLGPLVTFTITINPSPNMSVTGLSSLCGGVTSVDTLIANGADTYLWSANAASATTNSVIVSPSSITVYTVTGTYNVNSCSNSSTFTVSSLPQINISGTTTICNGDNTTLYATGANTYTWSNTANTNSINIIPSNSATYSVTGTDINGCTGSAASTVTVNPLPSISVNTPTICVGNTATLTASGASTYTWSTTETTASITASPTLTTNYTVTGTDGNNCVNQYTLSIIVNNCTTIIEKMSGIGNMINIYPNPAQNNFTIESSTNEKQILQIFDVNGKLILSQTINGNTNIDASNLSMSVYTINILSSEGVVNKRLVIVR